MLSALLRRRGVRTVAGGRHAGHFVEDALQHVDAVVTGEPERAVPAVFAAQMAALNIEPQRLS